MDDNKYESFEDQINPKTMSKCRSRISKINSKLVENKLKQLQKEIELENLIADEVEMEKQLAILSKKAELLFGDPMVVSMLYNTRYNTRYNKRYEW